MEEGRTVSQPGRPCAACKFLRRNCTEECVYAPYFPPEYPELFESTHGVYGARNIAKFISEVPASRRLGAVQNLERAALAHLHLVHLSVSKIQAKLANAKKEFAYQNALRNIVAGNHLASSAFCSPDQVYVLQQHLSNIKANLAIANNELATNGIRNNNVARNYLASSAQLQNPQQQELLEAQQVAAAAREQQQAMMRAYEQQQEIMRFNAGFEPSAGSAAVAVAGRGGFVQMSSAHNGGQGEMSTPSLALGGRFNNVVGAYQMQQQPQHGGEHGHQQTPQSQQQGMMGAYGQQQQLEIPEFETWSELYALDQFLVGSQPQQTQQSQQQELLEAQQAQQLAVVAAVPEEQQGMMGAYGQPQQQQENPESDYLFDFDALEQFLLGAH